MFVKKHDVFISYHGTYEEESSYSVATEVYNELLKRGYNCFFFPLSKTDSYKSNMIDVIQSRTFLLICNSKIHRTEDGQIDRTFHYELSVEIDAFFGASQTGDDVKTKDAKVITVGPDWRKGDEEKLHPLFRGRTHIHYEDAGRMDEIVQWVQGRIDEQKDNNEYQGVLDILKTYLVRSDLVADINLRKRIEAAKNVYAMGISNSELMGLEYSVFINALKNGCEFRILFLDPDCESTALREKEENVREGRIKKTTEDKLEIAKDILDEIEEDMRDRFKVMTYKRCPRINLLIIDQLAVLQYYDSFNRGMNNPSFLIQDSGTEKSLFMYCLTKFREMLTEAEEYQFD